MLEKLKRQAWVQPMMPQLRRIRRDFDTIRRIPLLWPEERASKAWLAKRCPQAALIEAALAEVSAEGGYFGGWALSRSALRSLCGELLTAGSDPLIVEFGSGQSTLFWNALARKLSLHIHSFEHDPYWHASLSPRLALGPRLQYTLSPLKQLSPAERAWLWQHPQEAAARYPELGQPVPESEYANTRLPDSFYTIEPARGFAPGSIDALVLDGPNGSGRSIAFPLLLAALAPQALVLIDDYSDYPFLDDLGRLRAYETLHIQVNAGKRWCLVRLKP